jgi:hypothetical protein
MVFTPTQRKLLCKFKKKVFSFQTNWHETEQITSQMGGGPTTTTKCVTSHRMSIIRINKIKMSQHNYL